MLEALLERPLVVRLGWTLAHSLWQGAALALLPALVWLALSAAAAAPGPSFFDPRPDGRLTGPYVEARGAELPILSLAELAERATFPLRVPAEPHAEAEPVRVGSAPGEHLVGDWVYDRTARSPEERWRWDGSRGHWLAWREGGVVYVLGTHRPANGPGDGPPAADGAPGGGGGEGGARGPVTRWSASLTAPGRDVALTWPLRGAGGARGI